MKDITLGQYFPGESVMHRLDPRAKLILAVLYIVAIFAASSVGAYIMLIALTILLVYVSGIPYSVFLKGLRPLLYIVVFTTVINVFMTKGDDILFEIGFIHIYREGIVNAVLMILRVMLLVSGSGLFLTYTTSPITLTDGLEQLLMPLKKLKLPIHEFSMMMTIALRFIPTLVEETDKIMNAQKARGADFSSGGIIARARALIPILVPLFVSAFKRADELAVAMECRCYRGDNGRTRMNVLHFGGVDICAMVIGVLVIASVAVLDKYFPIISLIR